MVVMCLLTPARTAQAQPWLRTQTWTYCISCVHQWACRFQPSGESLPSSSSTHWEKSRRYTQSQDTDACKCSQEQEVTKHRLTGVGRQCICYVTRKPLSSADSDWQHIAQCKLQQQLEAKAGTSAFGIQPGRAPAWKRTLALAVRYNSRALFQS